MALTTNFTAIALKLLEGLNCARSLSVSILMRANEWGEIYKLDLDPRHYIDAEAYFRAAQATALLKKCKSVDPTVDLKKKAKADFFSSEHRCFRTNLRLSPFLYNSYESKDGAVYQFITECRKEIERVIGKRPPAMINGRFGSGATMSDPYGLTTIPDKIASRPTLTRDAWTYVSDFSRTAWGQLHVAEDLTEVRGNSFFTVPKNAVSLRGCCKEPSLNVFFQLAFGQVMKERLKAWGLDLWSGQETHGDIAEIGSITGHYATLDLSKASDTVSSVLVELMLPDLWFQELNALRSPMTKIGHKWVKLEKFSSMGNGYTFELETLIFSVITKVACRHRVTPGKNLFVYGDDIIIPNEFSADVVAALTYFGFETNKEKSFFDGPFRESCGSDYFLGVKVRPFYLKEEPYEPHQWISFANGLRRSAYWYDSTGEFFRCIRAAWDACLCQLPDYIRRLRGPTALGDLVIADDEANWTYRWEEGIRYFRVWTVIDYKPPFQGRGSLVSFYHFSPDVQMASALYGITLRHDRYIVPRDATASYGRDWVPFS